MPRIDIKKVDSKGLNGVDYIADETPITFKNQFNVIVLAINEGDDQLTVTVLSKKDDTEDIIHIIPKGELLNFTVPVPTHSSKGITEMICDKPDQLGVAIMSLGRA